MQQIHELIHQANVHIVDHLPFFKKNKGKKFSLATFLGDIPMNYSFPKHLRFYLYNINPVTDLQDPKAQTHTKKELIKR